LNLISNVKKASALRAVCDPEATINTFALPSHTGRRSIITVVNYENDGDEFGEERVGEFKKWVSHGIVVKSMVGLRSGLFFRRSYSSCFDGPSNNTDPDVVE